MTCKKDFRNWKKIVNTIQIYHVLPITSNKRGTVHIQRNCLAVWKIKQNEYKLNNILPLSPMIAALLPKEKVHNCVKVPHHYSVLLNSVWGSDLFSPYETTKEHHNPIHATCQHRRGCTSQEYCKCTVKHWQAATAEMPAPAH